VGGGCTRQSQLGSQLIDFLSFLLVHQFFEVLLQHLLLFEQFLHHKFGLGLLGRSLLVVGVVIRPFCQLRIDVLDLAARLGLPFG